MNNQKLQKSGLNDDEADTQESLLRLVAPELALLSTYWLAFLKDYALLSLPPGIKFLLVIVLLFVFISYYAYLIRKQFLK